MVSKNVLHYIKCIMGIDKPVTQTTKNEQKALYKYSKLAKFIVEIGVFEGYNTREFALNSSNDTVIFAIDPFIKGSLGFSYLKAIAINNWKRNNVLRKIKILRGLSWNMYNQINNALDLVFIDGDHSFESVKKDFILFSQKLSANGVIAFHDARVFKWGSVRLIEEIIKPNRKWKIIEEIDSTVFIKQT